VKIAFERDLKLDLLENVTIWGEKYGSYLEVVGETKQMRISTRHHPESKVEKGKKI